jgi:hypothetical protein
VWADTLLHAEQQHLLRLLLWSGLSIIAGTAAITTIAARRLRSPLLAQFSLQMIGWGVVVGAIAALEWHGLHLRDVSGEIRLERLLWMNIGFDAGFVGIGGVLAVAGRLLARNVGAVGAGVAIAVQGLALLLIDLQLAAVVSR